MAVKKARLKVVVLMSCGSITFIITSSPASLAAAVEVAVLCSEVLSLLPAVSETLTVKNEFDESVIVDE
ncbi:uncharacterized protein BDCG_17596 [Blastomyces dermatitidis ER-3]|uniref:Secreted protein n=1 Tax=Ajellomyces dermatitidis (strain ER-3 / ATCC MYA-2586) TaxID=559297 RepID=A0ABX2VZD0_AJEDR|nr:uncharacterized protein BDCG_17596 [Blastomyces dermatitidis ER-3]OAT02497.1 hypothetical protein BDCG_17596 [Blastomyces dermatitidis ER-3]